MASFIIIYFPPRCVHFFYSYADHDYCLSPGIQRLHIGDKPLYNLHKGYKFAYLIVDTSVDHKASPHTCGSYPCFFFAAADPEEARIVYGPEPSTMQKRCKITRCVYKSGGLNSGIGPAAIW